jgi:hypothetical protein
VSSPAPAMLASADRTICGPGVVGQVVDDSRYARDLP